MVPVADRLLHEVVLLAYLPWVLSFFIRTNGRPPKPRDLSISVGTLGTLADLLPGSWVSLCTEEGVRSEIPPALLSTMVVFTPTDSEFTK